MTTVLDRLARIEAKLDQLLGEVEDRKQTMVDVRNLTTKQHAALQMLLRGASNAEIAERFGVSINTAKVYVRSLFAKVGEHTRTRLVLRMAPLFSETDDADYQALSGGLPKHWDRDFVSVEKDAFAHLYRRAGEDDGP
jgi:DNA-binding CsgD family transcriptional regulator